MKDADAREALAAFVDAVGSRDPVAVEGCRTRWSAGGALVEGTRLVRAPSGVVEHRPEEMTVRVLAGTAVAELHERLGAARQRTALPERGGTVGGALAVGENDLASLTRGRIRDAVLEVRYVSSDGRLVKGGAPTVKNVSGFDLPRLMVGALGTLGLIVEAVLRTRPVPPAALLLRAHGADPFATKEAARTACFVLWDGATTFVALEGHDVDVESDRRVIAALGDFHETEDLPHLFPHRWSLRPSDLHELDRDATGDFVASIGVGLVFAARPQPPRHLPPGVRTLNERMKAEFDPTGRLNPGRDPLWRA